MWGYDPQVAAENVRKRKAMEDWFTPSALLQFWEDAITNANQFNAYDNNKKFSLSLLASVYFDDYRDVSIVQEGVRNTINISKKLGKKIDIQNLSHYLEEVALGAQIDVNDKAPDNLLGKTRLNAILYLESIVKETGQPSSERLVKTLETVIYTEDMDLVALVAAGILQNLGVIENATAYYLEKRYLSDDRKPDLRVTKSGVIKPRP